MITPLLKQIEKLVDVIMEYESDTFSASASGITRKQAKQIAERFALEAIEELYLCNTMDGIKIDSALEDLYTQKKDAMV